MLVAGLPFDYIKPDGTKETVYFASIRKHNQTLNKIKNLKKLLNKQSALELQSQDLLNPEKWTEELANDLDEKALQITLDIGQAIYEVYYEALIGACYTEEMAKELAESIPLEKYSEIETKICMGGGFFTVSPKV